jgi:hypothetical protein
MNPLKHTIKHLKDRLYNPKLYQPRTACLYIIHCSQLIRNTSEPNSEGYIDNFYKCTKLGKKIKKRQCMNCKLYKPLDNGNKLS